MKCDTLLRIILLFATQKTFRTGRESGDAVSKALQSPSTVKNECSNLINFNNARTHSLSRSFGFAVPSSCAGCIIG